MKTLTEFLKKSIVNDRTLQNYYPELYRTFNKIEMMIQEAWRSWDDETTSPYWEGYEKSEEPTDSFSIFWIENEDYYADGFDVAYLESAINE